MCILRKQSGGNTKSMADVQQDGQVHSDALVFFGASGDLARKQIFPALYDIAKRGALNVLEPASRLASAWASRRVRRAAVRCSKYRLRSAIVVGVSGVSSSSWTAVW